MAHYIITIQRYESELGVLHFDQAIEIECHTNYTLLADIPEWIREEIDPEATVTERFMPDDDDDRHKGTDDAQ